MDNELIEFRNNYLTPPLESIEDMFEHEEDKRYGAVGLELDIEAEYALVQKKQSKLSANKRRWVVIAYNRMVRDKEVRESEESMVYVAGKPNDILTGEVARVLSKNRKARVVT